MRTVSAITASSALLMAVLVHGAQEPSAGEREGPAPRMGEPSAGEREGPAPRMKEPSAGERPAAHAAGGGTAPRTTESATGDFADIDDEIIVTAERPERGEMPSPTYIVQTYSVVNRGSRLYREGKYAEALPYLVTAAKRGFKWAQARAGDIYLHGRGGVPRDIEAGIGWLGVAAMPETDPSIRNYFRDAMAEVRPEHLLHFATIVADYRRQWGSDGYRVTCERAPKTDGIHGSQSLRLKRLRCTFMDEIPLCRTPYGDPSGGMEWICDRPRE